MGRLARALQRRRPAGGGGRLPSLGQDHDRAHREYVAQLGPEHRTWLFTKPFDAPPSYELGRCLHSFAHIVDVLGLATGSRVLDVGCGPGWLSEWLSRCGYNVTGIDISQDMIDIARERIARIPGPIAEGLNAQAEFHVVPVHEMAWQEEFDAAILYDALHHFHDEVAVLEAIRATLVPGGQIYVHEGVRPEPGSAGERELIEEMERYGTLESPFDPDYLLSVVERAGFVDVRRLVEVDGLFDVGDERAARSRVAEIVRFPETNTLVAMNPGGDGMAGAPEFLAEIQAVGDWAAADEGRTLRHRVRVTNAGRSRWPTVRSFPFPPGTVTVGPYTGDIGARRELSRIPLPHSVRPGESVEVVLEVSRDALGDASSVTVDLVRERICWFTDLGSPPLTLSAPGSARREQTRGHPGPS